VVAVTGVGGGAGRTTTTVALGATLAVAKHHPVVALDAAGEPAGMLASRVPRTTPATVHEYLRDPAPADAYAADSYLNVDASGLRVLAGGRPGHREPVTDAGVADAVLRLARWHPVLLLDLPPISSGSAWPWVRRRAAVVVLVVRAAAPDLVLLAEMLNVLQQAGMAAPRQRAVVVVNHTVPRTGGRAARVAEQLVAARVRSVVRVPFDRRLCGGQEVALYQLARRTRIALLRVAAQCAAQFQ
jgi:MinD-like ATPase involved in chromosome partitioning or flagellar assembly